MTKLKSILEDLYTDSGAFDAEKVANVLKSILVIQREEHSVFFKSGSEINTEDKILAYALVKKLLKHEDVEKSSGVSANETHQRTGLPKGTVDPAFQKLKKEGWLLGKGSNYEIPAHKIQPVLERLEGNLNKRK